MVGPLDSQIAINQSLAAEKVQEVQQRHPDLQQKQFALQLQEEQEKKQRDIRDTEQADQVLLRNSTQKEEKNRKRKKSRRDRLKNGEASLSEEASQEEAGSRVDVFV